MMESEERERDRRSQERTAEWATSLRQHQPQPPPEVRHQHHASNARLTEHLSQSTINMFFPIRRHPELVPALPRERDSLRTPFDMSASMVVDGPVSSSTVMRSRTANSVVGSKRVNMTRINELAQPPARRFGMSLCHCVLCLSSRPGRTLVTLMSQHSRLHCMYKLLPQKRFYSLAFIIYSLLLFVCELS